MERGSERGDGGRLPGRDAHMYSARKRQVDKGQEPSQGRGARSRTNGVARKAETTETGTSLQRQKERGGLFRRAQERRLDGRETGSGQGRGLLEGWMRDGGMESAFRRARPRPPVVEVVPSSPHRPPSPMAATVHMEFVACPVEPVLSRCIDAKRWWARRRRRGPNHGGRACETGPSGLPRSLGSQGRRQGPARRRRPVALPSPCACRCRRPLATLPLCTSAASCALGGRRRWAFQRGLALVPPPVSRTFRCNSNPPPSSASARHRGPASPPPVHPPTSTSTSY